MAKEVKLVLRGYKKYIASERGNVRYRKFDKQGNVISDISTREFQRRAKRVEVKPRVPKKRLTVHDQRVRWYASHINSQVWENRYLEEEEYVSYEQAAHMPEFMYYEDLMRSHYKEDRDVAREFFDELEEEFITKDWGETP